MAMNTSTVMSFEQSAALRERAHRAIPAGCHTYSKGDDQFPQLSPGFINRASGCYAYDVDGNEFVDWGMGLRSVILGHAYSRVNEAAIEQIRLGQNFTRPAPIETEVAEHIIDLIPSADMVKFAKDGSDVTSAAIRMARAYTGRDYVAICKEHPFFSFYDWFIGTTPVNAGVPDAISNLSLTFHYNDLPSLQKLFDEHPGQISSIMMEPVTTDEPNPGFLEGVRDLATREGAVLIFDEMISGFRWDLRGAQTYFGVTPDMSTFGKAVANGFSVAALTGRRDIMELGGLRHDKPRVFLLSSTHGGETHALAACKATLTEMAEKNVTAHLWMVGKRLQDGFNEAARRAGVAGQVKAAGYACSPILTFKDKNGKSSSGLRTLYLQEMIAQGILIPYIAPCFMHTVAEIDRTAEASERALRQVARVLNGEPLGNLLVGPPTRPVFRRFNNDEQ